MTEIAGNALISVPDPDPSFIVFAGHLHASGWQILAPQETCGVLAENGIPSEDVGRLSRTNSFPHGKTHLLSEAVAIGLLSDPSDSAEAQGMRAFGHRTIDLVCVQPEKADFGTQSILRMAAEGNRLVVTEREQLQEVTQWLNAGRPNDVDLRSRLIARARYHTGRIALEEAIAASGGELVGVLAEKFEGLKYGENPWQTPAAIYMDVGRGDDLLAWDQFEQMNIKNTSYINTTDITSGVRTAVQLAAGLERNLDAVSPLAIGIKHGNACGIGVGAYTVTAVRNLIRGSKDALSDGVVVVGGGIDRNTARTLIFPETGSGMRRLAAVAGAAVSAAAIRILSENRVPVFINPALGRLGSDFLDTSPVMRQLRDGWAVQPNFNRLIDFSGPYLEDTVTFGEPFTIRQKRDAIIAWAAGSTSLSNTISIANEGALISNSIGQPDRLSAVELAILRTVGRPAIYSPTYASGPAFQDLELHYHPDKVQLVDAVAFSDSCFTSSEGPDLLRRAGVKALVTTYRNSSQLDLLRDMESRGMQIVAFPDSDARAFYGH